MGSGTDNIEEFLEEDVALRKKKAEAAHPEHATRNRYGDWWWWTKESENTYKFNMTGNWMDYCRIMGDMNEDNTGIDTICMFDPSGGPYIAVGSLVDGKPITKIYPQDDTYYVEVSELKELEK